MTRSRSAAKGRSTMRPDLLENLAPRDAQRASPTDVVIQFIGAAIELQLLGFRKRDRPGRFAQLVLEPFKEAGVALQQSGPGRSEHRVRVCGGVGYRLQHVPVLHDPALIIEPKDVDSGIVLVTWPLLMTMQDDMIALAKDALEMHALSGVLASHPLEVLNESVLAVCDVRVVLNVDVPDVPFDGLPWPAMVEHQVVEGSNGSLVPLEIRVHATLSVGRISRGPK